ncbi:MAG: outer membrane lipid asymmetry maintenance protein MlaD [Rubellimicrobium sp.]|nr:outer membrane lipid asymmetry maintenance protein MlaD [Rubellimicrobium sp.]
MEGNRSEVAVGALVLIAAVGFLVWLLQFAAPLGRGGYEVTASFRSAEGVAVGSEVRLAGIRIGQVAGMTLDPATFRARTAMRLDDGVVIPSDSSAVIASDGLMGGAYVEIVPGGAPDDLAPGGEILDTQGAVSLLDLLVKYASGSGEGGE